MSALNGKPEILGSWKEIAAYLGKGVRTVQRWERSLGLPVTRPNLRDKGIVCANAAEIDAWLNSDWRKREEPLKNVKDANFNFLTVRLEVAENIAASRASREHRRQLMDEVHTSTGKLMETCRSMCQQIKMEEPKVS